MSKVILLLINLPIFFLTQMAAVTFMKWGATAPNRYWLGVIFSNLVTIVGVALLVNLYKLMPAAMTQAVCNGGAFILCQLTLLAIFREQITLGGWIGISLIFAGVMVFAFTK
jgi:multidrug transporter EmrE-like cation transporter